MKNEAMLTPRMWSCVDCGTTESVWVSKKYSSLIIQEGYGRCNVVGLSEIGTNSF